MSRHALYYLWVQYEPFIHPPTYVEDSCFDTYKAMMNAVIESLRLQMDVTLLSPCRFATSMWTEPKNDELRLMLTHEPQIALGYHLDAVEDGVDRMAMIVRTPDIRLFFSRLDPADMERTQDDP